MALTGFKVIEEEHTLDGVAIHCWDRTKLVLALVTRTAIDDAFDRFRPYEPNRKRLTMQQGNSLVKANIDAFARVIASKSGQSEHLLVTQSGYQRPVLVIDYNDVVRSGEALSAEVLVNAA